MKAHTKTSKAAAPVVAWAVYLVSAMVLAVLFLTLTGPGVSQLALVTSTLVIAVLLYPLKRSLSDYIERRLREVQALKAARETQKKRQG